MTAAKRQPVAQVQGARRIEGIRKQVEELIMNQKVNIAVQKIVEHELQARNVEYLF